MLISAPQELLIKWSVNFHDLNFIKVEERGVFYQGRRSASISEYRTYEAPSMWPDFFA